MSDQRPSKDGDTISLGGPVTDVYVFLADHGDGTEGIVGFRSGDVFVPMVDSSRERAYRYREVAAKIAKKTKQTIRLVRFVIRENLETYT